VQDRTATDEHDPKKAKRMAFVEKNSRRIPRIDQRDSAGMTVTGIILDEEERARRVRFQSRRRLLITEEDPLDGDDVVFDGKALSEQFERFLKTAKTHARANTESFNDAIAFTVGARNYGEGDDTIDLLRYKLVKQDAERLTLVGHGMRLNFRRIVPKDGNRRPVWKLESKESRERSGRNGYRHSKGHGPGRLE
jgi:hypothetical protein